MKTKILELTKENQEQYLEQVAELEKVVLKSMEEDGRIGQLFITGKEDIKEYIESEQNTVIVGVDEEKQVQSATYITQGQMPFTYNDITKYFKYGKQYQEYVKATYPSKAEYQNDLLDAYKQKLEAFAYAKRKIEKENLEYNGIQEFLKHEITQNEFHEKSMLREKINKYMSEYIMQKGEKVQKIYEKFYWTTAQDIAKEIGKKIDMERVNQTEIGQYEQYLSKAILEIHEQPQFDIEKYYTANTQNAVEIDTYLTNPNKRHVGIARILVYEGIKKHIQKHFQNSENEEIFLCSTLHRENLSSKYVSEFFGLKDNLFVKRRQGRNREVHICKISRQDANKYLENMQNKLAVLYGYNPESKKISEEEKKKIIEEQLQYEKDEFKRLNKARHYTCNYKGNIKDIQSKANKILKLEEQLKKQEPKLDDEGR